VNKIGDGIEMCDEKIKLIQVAIFSFGMHIGEDSFWRKILLPQLDWFEYPL